MYEFFFKVFPLIHGFDSVGFRLLHTSAWTKMKDDKFFLSLLKLLFINLTYIRLI